MSRDGLADDVWRTLAALVIDHRDSWKHAVIDRTGLPFSRIRVLRRLAPHPLTVKQLATAATMDAPATTVAVNDLEERGLVVRETDPGNRRCKTVTLTDAGRAVLTTIESIDDPAPAVFDRLDAHELQALRAIFAKLSAQS